MLMISSWCTWASAATVPPSATKDTTLKIDEPRQPFLDLRADLSLDTPPIQPIDASALVVEDQTLIPLPPAAWTGFTALASLGIVGSVSRAFRRFIQR
jgi:hypothetical protein